MHAPRAEFDPYLIKFSFLLSFFLNFFFPPLLENRDPGRKPIDNTLAGVIRQGSREGRGKAFLLLTITSQGSIINSKKLRNPAEGGRGERSVVQSSRGTLQQQRERKGLSLSSPVTCLYK